MWRKSNKKKMEMDWACSVSPSEWIEIKDETEMKKIEWNWRELRGKGEKITWENRRENFVIVSVLFPLICEMEGGGGSASLHVSESNMWEINRAHMPYQI